MGKTRSGNNPNNANQYVVDPRQAIFLSYYLDPKSETFSNGLQSAVRAGFTDAYAKALLAKMPTWLSEKVTDMTMVAKAERNLQKVLDLETKIQAMGAFGPIYQKVKNKKGKVTKKIPVMVQSIGLLKVQAEVSEFVTERLARKKYGKVEDSTLIPITNFTQININVPNRKPEDAGDQPDPKAVRRVVSSE